MSPTVDLALIQWAEGARRLAELDEPAARRAAYERVVEEIAAEIERRVGQTFDLEELAAVYESSEPWVLDVAQRTTDQPRAYDLSVVQDAAFDRMARSATDFHA